MSNLLKKNEKGFTLIEIVLVLAIAGLLLVIIFLAVSGAQRSRRDSQRKNDNARIESQLESFASNNNGAYPVSAAEKASYTSKYVNGMVNPDGGSYTYAWNVGLAPAASTLSTATNTIDIYISGRIVSTCMGLEQGVQCLSNQ